MGGKRNTECENVDARLLNAARLLLDSTGINEGMYALGELEKTAEGSFIFVGKEGQDSVALPVGCARMILKMAIAEKEARVRELKKVFKKADTSEPWL